MLPEGFINNKIIGQTKNLLKYKTRDNKFKIEKYIIEKNSFICPDEKYIVSIEDNNINIYELSSGKHIKSFYTNSPSGRPIIPTTPCGIPIIPNTPCGIPIIPNTSSGSPIIPTTPSGIPIIPTTPSGSPIIPNTPSGSPIFPTTQSGNPIIQTTVKERLIRALTGKFSKISGENYTRTFNFYQLFFVNCHHIRLFLTY
jgi:hypothetical protein